jgi:hypothetical protein
MKRLIVMTALIVTLWHGGVAGASTAGESYLCVTDMATGFGFDKGRRQWHRANLQDERKYLVSKATTATYAWEVEEVGETHALIECEGDFTEFGFLFCDGLGDFRMNKHTLRFLFLYPIGYWNTAPAGSPERGLRVGADTPHMAIGKCGPLSGAVLTPQDVPPQVGPSPRRTRERRQ